MKHERPGHDEDMYMCRVQGTAKTTLPHPLGPGFTGLSMLYRDYIGVILRLHWDNGKENGIYYLGFRDALVIVQPESGPHGLGFRV